MDKIKIGNKKIEYRLIRTKRKTIGIYIRPGEGVLIRAPQRISNKKIQEVLFKKSNWIITKLEEVSKVLPPPVPLKFVNGEQIPYLGEYYELRIQSNGDKKGVIIDFDKIYFNIFINKNIEYKDKRNLVKDSLIRWYRKQAGCKINERVEKYQEYIGKKPVNIRIKNQKTIWGSCSSRGNLNFNWKLIMAPLPVLDYIVVHELVHLLYPNHSRRFWDFVEEIIPEYRDRKEWLKINGLLLNII